MNPKLVKQCVAEFIGTFTLIFIGVGAIDNGVIHVTTPKIPDQGTAAGTQVE